MRRTIDFICKTWQDRRLRAGLLVALVLIVGLALLLPHIGWAADAPATGGGKGAGDQVVIFLTNMLYGIVKLLANIFIVIVNILISVASYNDFINATAVQKGWVIVRDICNMFFIIVLLVIAFGTILKIEQYRYNRLLGKLIIYAFLINFSKFIAGLWIDIGQVIMMTFVNGFKDAAAGNLASGLGMGEMLTIAKNSTADVDSSALFNAMLLAIALLVIAIIVVVIMTVILLFRILMLWILIVTSPLAFLTRIFPNTAKYSDQWWGEFNKYIIVGPVMAFFIWLALSVIAVNGANLPNGFKQVSDREQTTVIQGDGAAAGTISASITAISDSDRLLSFMITIGMLLGALQAAQQIGVAGSKLAGDWSQKIRSGGMTAAGVLGQVATARLLMRGARAGGKKIAGTVGRQLSEGQVRIPLTKTRVRPGKYFTKKYWEGYWEMGKDRQARTDKSLQAMGREGRQKMQYQTLRRLTGRKALTPHDEYNQSVSEGFLTAISEHEKKVGKHGNSETRGREWYTAMMQAKSGGKDEIRHMGGVNISTVANGNLDDVFEQLVKNGLLHKGNFKQFGFRDWQDVTGEGLERGGLEEERARALLTSSSGLDREKFDPFIIGQKLAKEKNDEGVTLAKYMKMMTDATIDPHERKELAQELSGIIDTARERRDTAVASASDNELVSLRALYEAAEEARLNGHTEQTVANLDEKTGRSHMLDPLEQMSHVIGNRSKMTTAENVKATTPHGRNPYIYATDEEGVIQKDEYGNVNKHASTDAQQASPLGAAEAKMYFPSMQQRDMSNMGFRNPGRMLGIEGAPGVRDQDVIFDKGGEMVNPERWEKAKKVYGIDALRTAYAAGFRIQPEKVKLPDESGYEGQVAELKNRKPDEPAAAGATTGGWTRKTRRTRDAHMELVEEEYEEREIKDDKTGTTRVESRRVERAPIAEDRGGTMDEAEQTAEEAEKQSKRTRQAIGPEFTGAIDKLHGKFEDLIKVMEEVQPKMAYPDQKKQMERLIKTAKEKSTLISPVERPGFLKAAPHYKEEQMKEMVKTMREMVKTLRETTKVIKPEASTGDSKSGDKE